MNADNYLYEGVIQVCEVSYSHGMKTSRFHCIQRHIREVQHLKTNPEREWFQQFLSFLYSKSVQISLNHDWFHLLLYQLACYHRNSNSNSKSYHNTLDKN